MHEKKYLGYNHTIYACYIGYIVQAIVNNFIPLLFLTFQGTFGISLDRITYLITVNFGIQLLTDLASAKLVDRIGYRSAALIAHTMAAVGLAGLGIFPYLFKNAYVGILISVCFYAVGGGLLEVIVSPIVEACPTDKKEAAMSMLHSFYCWGQVGVVLISTLFFTVAGIRYWRVLAFIWALVPLFNIFYFLKVPVNALVEEGEGMNIGELVKSKMFWLLFIMMMCSGASELAMSQWASAFAESGLGISKTMGDLAGPCLFAVFMGSARAYYGKNSEKISLMQFMKLSCVLCIISYLLATLSPIPVLALVGCALCGLSVGIMWPGTFSIAAKSMRNGGTAMFAFLALAGDIGCAGGPTLVGVISEAFGENLQKGLIFAVVFPVVLLILCFNMAAQEVERHDIRNDHESVD